MTIEQLIQENAMLRQHIVDNQLAMPEEISTAQPAVSFGRALRNHLEAVAALPVEEVPASNDVTDALERMDALLQPGLGLLAVGDKSATAEASRREKFAADVYADLAAADNQDVPLEEYPARILKVLDSIVGPRHPVVIKWRNDAIRNCIAIAYKYCRDPESHKYLKQDLEALLTAEPAPAAKGVRDE